MAFGRANGVLFIEVSHVVLIGEVALYTSTNIALLALGSNSV